VTTDIIFLHASDEILLQRYSESRRRHPLAEKGKQLRAAIATERSILNIRRSQAYMSLLT
jgi:UPF0042 nucleotide-binding protein